MSNWTHAICPACWLVKNPNRAPVRVATGDEEICCFCGEPTDDGIYLREDPRSPELRCGGRHGAKEPVQ